MQHERKFANFLENLARGCDFVKDVPIIEARDTLSDAARAITATNHRDASTRRKNLIEALRYSLSLPAGQRSVHVDRDLVPRVRSIADILDETGLELDDLYKTDILLSKKTAVAFLKSRTIPIELPEFRIRSTAPEFLSLFDRPVSNLPSIGNLYTYAEVVILARRAIELREPTL